MTLVTTPGAESTDADLFDIVGAPTALGAGEDSVRVALDPADAAALAALAARTQIAAAAIWRAGWALVLARLAGVEQVRIALPGKAGAWTAAVIAVPGSGELAGWLAMAATAAEPHVANGVSHGSNGVSAVARAAAGAAALPHSGWSDGDAGLAPVAEHGPALVWQIASDPDRGASGASDPSGAVIARFAGARLDRATVERLGELLRVAMAGMVAPGARLESVSPLTAAERRRVVEDWNQTAVEYRPEATVHGLFREQAAAHPERIALIWDGDQLSYGELDRWSDAMAERLIAAGVASDQPVALCLERSPEAVVAALAILKAGGAYLPLDPDYPTERLAFAISDAGARVLVTRRSRAGALAQLAARTVFVDPEGASDRGRPGAGAPAGQAAQPRAERAAPRTRAYVMYTSGSTGQPKGVQIEHRSIIRLVGRVSYVRLDPETRFLHAAPLGFDASTLELWGPLLHGGACVVYSDPVPTGRGLARIIAAHGVTTAWLTAALFNSVVDEDAGLLSGLRQLFTGGEALSPSHVRRALAALPDTELVNGYGPTECTTFTTTFSIPRDIPADTAIPIGRPIADTQVYVLNRAGAPVPVGIIGELYVGGLGVARGYLARPELDAERFVTDHMGGDYRLYRTGDRVRWRPDGAIDFLGRADGQVKLRGFRIELGEIEARLGALPGIAACAVMIRDDGPGGKRLVAYVVAQPAGAGDTGEPASISAPALRSQLAHTLPDFMVPSAFVSLAQLPVTANGKLDRARLPAPTSARPELAQPYRAPSGAREIAICRAFGELLGIDRVGALDGFFELGGNSLLAVRLLSRLRTAGMPEVSPAMFFAAPTPGALARALDGEAGLRAPARQSAAGATGSHGARDRARAGGNHHEPIAIIGMAGRFPGAGDIEALWANLCAGRESIRWFKPDELDPSIPAAQRSDPSYIPARGVLDGVDLFDAAFFGISPLEAQMMDPQHRHFLEVSWQALEHAGYAPETAPGPVSVFGGMFNASYYQHHLVHRPDLINRVGEMTVMLANEKDYITTRAAHRLGLTGPAVSVHTACSTSLVALSMAMDSLRTGSSDMALAGGASITCPPNSGYFYTEGSMASSDGHTRAFDAKASGTVFSDGVAMVVLRRLSDAIADGDTVYAVVLGAALNNDGAERASFTAPSPEGQAQVIAAAHDAAGIDARSVSYLEAHGTGTPLGDPIEIEGLTRAFRRHTQDRGFCAIGSLKSNIGHSVIAAGATSLIKLSLALSRRTLPPSINFASPSPSIDFARTPFRVQTELAPWPQPASGPRRAGVSSFGFGGTNAHAVLEEAPPAVPSTASPHAAELIVVSARTAAALAEASDNLARFLPRLPVDDPAALSDVAHTLQVGRRAFSHRRYVVASSAAEAARLLASPEPSKAGSRELGAELPEIGFLCPGQGSQYPRMGAGLYHSEPAFRAAYDECCAILEAVGAFGGGDPRAVLFSEDPQALVPTSATQPAVFALEYALARMWMSWGVAPSALIGHSVGEWVCAALAEVMSLEDALSLVVERGQRMQAQPAGSMLSVRLPAAELAPRLPAGVVIAAENAPGLCVASGPTEDIARLEAELTAADITARRLVTSHAFHSAMMDPVIEPLAERIATLRLSPPRIPILSTVTARWLSDAEATSTRYWAEHLRLPVRFAPAVAALLAEPRRVLLEIGPRASLTALARQAVGAKRALPPAIPCLGDSAERESETVAAALGQLWTLGQAIDWAGYRADERRRRVPVPGYPFQRQRYWVDAPVRTAALAGVQAPGYPPLAAPASITAPGQVAMTAAAAAPGPSAPVGPIAAVPVSSSSMEMPAMSNAVSPVASPRVDRRPRMLALVCELVEEVSGSDVTEADPATPWLELGLDSLTLTQLALQIQRSHAVKVTFRQIMEIYPTIASLAALLDERLPPDEPVAAPVAAAPAGAAPVAAAVAAVPFGFAPISAGPAVGAAAAGEPSPYIRQVIDQQLAVMAQQLAILGGGGAAAAPQLAAAVAAARPAQPVALSAPRIIAPPPGVASAAAPIAPAPVPSKNEDEPPAGPVNYDVKKAFGAIARIHTQADDITPQQRARLDALIARYTARTRKSKDYTTQHRGHMADPRVVNGFRPLTKELTYQIVIERSRGSRMWDIDGNEYVDVLSGFGMSLFGWQADFIRDAIHDQVERGFEIGPQHVLAGEVAELFCEVTGTDRAAFCNTGSEAVMGTMRIARTVTGRSLIAIFTGAYHGIFDEVIVRGTRKLKSIPAAPGIMPSASQNVIVLDYGTPESMAILRDRIDELAAIVVEPVQSRRPDFQPVEFLRELRTLTEDHGTLLIFDEVVCGFRAHPKGAQGLFDIQADLGSYGKVVGGGFSIGVIAGKRQFMDALDGGHWQYGDDSIPTVGVTYFAGTFVRHPLALAAAKAALIHMRDAGPALQERLTARTQAMVGEINRHMAEIGAPFKLNTFASLWRNVFTEDLPYGDLIYAMLRDRGIHILDNFPCFLTTAHTDDDIAAIVAAYKAAAAEMQASGFFPAARVAGKVAAVAGMRSVPSTEPQREIWLADRLGPEASLAYNESVSLHLRGELDVAALRQALRQLPIRHDALRATFASDGLTMRAAQIDGPDAPAAPELIVSLRELEDLAPEARDAELAAITARHVTEPFDLERGPLVRAELVRMTADHHVLVFTGHHIVLDGWSYWVLVKDLAALYGIATGSRSLALPAAPSFLDYAAACAASADSAEMRSNERWWIEQFATGVPALDLPTDRPRPALRTTRAGREDHVLPAALVAQIKRTGASLGASLFATLLAGFDALLYRLTGQTDVVVGIPAAGQAAAGLEGMIGHAVNMLPLRSRFARSDRFADLVSAARATMLDAYDHQDVTFGRVLQVLPLARDPSRLPLISAMFNIDQALTGEGHSLPGVAMELVSNPRHYETFELFVNAVDGGAAGMRLECQYNAELFDPATVRRWLSAFEVLLRGAVADPSQALGRLPIVSDADRRALARWNQTEVDYPRTARIEELIAQTARRQPDRIAVRARGGSLTYGQLADRAAAIAAELRAPGVSRGHRVGLLVDRDLDLLPAIVGTLTAGAAYVPLDPAFPADRLRFMVEDAELAAIITTSAIAKASAGVIGAVPAVMLDDVPHRLSAVSAAAIALPGAAGGDASGAAVGTSDDTAYVIYTSGSTGQPKGVCVPHRAVSNFLASIAREPGMSERDVVVAVTTLSFDIAVLELVLPLVVGAEIVLASRTEATDGVALAGLLEHHRASVMQATPATWRMLIETGWRGSAGLVALCGGEALPRELAAELSTRTAQLWNMYGPTETTVWSTVHRVTGSDAPILIGHPIANTQVHVLDEDLQPVPIGVVGELYIGGDGVTQGYLRRPELTQERFVADPSRVAPGARMYRTGDLGRWRPARDGSAALECLGRTDFQVKLRGYRIELGEIETALARHPAIAQAAVITREDRPGDVRLVGYLVARAAEHAEHAEHADPANPARPAIPSDEALRDHLARSLPDYMIPARFIALAQLPLTGSGKVDRKALPAPSGPALAGQGSAVAPRTPTEEIVAAAYRETLALPRLSVLDDFFALGGHSLLVAQMTARLSRTLGRTVAMRAGFEHPTVASLAAWLDAALVSEADAMPRIARRTETGPAPLSLMQQRVWYLEQLQLGRTVFNVPSAHRLHGPLDIDALGRAFAALVQRQTVLRTAIGTVGDAPAQIVSDHVDTAIPLEDLSAVAAEQREPRLAARIESEIAQVFDLTRAPLFRIRLFRLAPDDHVLFFMAHHIIWDGWSFDLFYEEIAALYAAQLAGVPATRPLPAVSYADFTVWHRDWLTGPELTRQLDHWRGKLAGAPDALDLPTDHPRPAVQSGDGATAWLSLPDATTAALRAVGLREGATLFMTLLGAWSALLHQLTRQPELVIGTPVRGRNLPELEQVMGFFVNALPLRLRIDPDASFLELLRRIRTEVIDAFGAQDVPFEHLVRMLDIKRDESRFPIYQAFFSYQDARQRPTQWGNVAHHNIRVFQPSAAQDIALWFLDNASGLTGGLNYNTDIIDPETAERWRDRFLALAEAIAADPHRSVRSLLELTGKERAQLAAWNQTERPLADDATLTGMVAGIARHGDRIAIRHRTGETTYAQLAAERDRIAAALAARGVGPGDVVALLLERGPTMLAALLGALAAGATYLPLDPGFPPARLAFMMADAGVKVVITDQAPSDDPGHPLAELPLDPQLVLAIGGAELAAAAGQALPAVTAAPDGVAYLIYTSGSTGRPKGVRVPQRAVANFLAAMAERPGLTASDRLVAVTTLSFDIAVLELLLPLVVGAEIILATRDQATDGVALRGLLDGTALPSGTAASTGRAGLVEPHRATIMQATPATWRMLIEAGWRGGSGFKALCGGEALPPELAESLLPRVGALWNMYGPTETTVWSTCGQVEAGQGGVSIGRPIDNTTVWILDDAGSPVPIGVPGELYIGGAGVALGYHERAELTKERFVPDPFSSQPGARLYRTGDLARWRSDGQLQHLGRTDFQVKVRGYRIELGEIEVAIARHPQVTEAVVVAQPGPGGESRLVGYLVARGPTAPTAPVLREHLRSSLPDYMVPAVFVALDRLPLTPNGKVDRRALPLPEAAPAGPAAGFNAPRTRGEQLVATVWRELLGVERISVSDNFLDLGGHSLLIMQAIAKLEARTGKRVSPRTFIFQTLEQIARDYESPRPEPLRPVPPPSPPPASRLSRWLSALIPSSKS
jgi:amino acid adenylation domain-containing protein